jgi:hypothetical protein
MPFKLIRVDYGSAGHLGQLKWSAIFSGGFVTIGLGIVFLLLGNAVGLSALKAVSPGIPGMLRFWSFIYTAGTLVLSYFVGGLVSTRSIEISGRGFSAIYALVAWGLASAFAVAVGAYVSPSIRLVLQGSGTNIANWLSICVIGLGMFSSLIGGASGKESVKYQRVEDTTIKRAA